MGIGIAQFGSIRSGAASLVDALAPSLGDRPHSATFAGALIIYFSAIGFLSGWLLTRLFLAPALSTADRRALQVLAEADRADAAGEPERADELRQEAVALLQRAAPVATRYEELRHWMPSSRQRTNEMERLVGEARQEARRGSFSPEEVRALFEMGKEGLRIYALGLMEGDGRLADFNAVLEVIEHSRSAFELSHGLDIARSMLPRLDESQRRRLAAVLQDQRNSGRITPGTDRWQRSQMILDSLEQRSG